MLRKGLICVLAALLLFCAVPFAAADTAHRLIIYWKADAIDFQTSDVWVWFPGRDGCGYPFTPCDFGAKCVVDVPDGVDMVGFIVRTNCSDPFQSYWGEANKDVEEDRFAFVPDGCEVSIYLLSGDSTIYSSADGGATLTVYEGAPQREEITPVSFDSIGDYRLMEPEDLPDSFKQRYLSDGELAQLSFDSTDLLAERFRSFADLGAWLEQKCGAIYANITINEHGRVSLDADFTLQWAPEMIGGAGAASLTQRLLSDDYPQMQIVSLVQIVPTYSAEGITFCSTVHYANMVPAEDGGFYILSAAAFSPRFHALSFRDDLGPLFVSDLSGLIPCGETEFADAGYVSQIYTTDSGRRLELDFDPDAGIYYLPIVSDPDAHIENRYVDPASNHPELVDPSKALDLSAFPFPETFDLSTDVDMDTAHALRGGTAEEAKERLRSVPDVLQYLFFNRFSTDPAGDLQFTPRDSSLTWHFNYVPSVVFERNIGNCGAVSGLCEYLLQDDYEEVGLVGVTYVEGGGGGHVFNYVKDHGVYIVMDFNAWTIEGYRPEALSLRCSTSLDEAVKMWAGGTDYVKLAYVYRSGQGDAPIGWDWNNHVSYLIEDYVHDLHIVFETPEEGYVYEFVQIEDRIRQIIELTRND